MKKVLLTILLFHTLIALQTFTSKELFSVEASHPGDNETVHLDTTDQHPIIFFKEPNFNFGKIFKGQKLEHIYTFENKGKDDLKINKVKSSCGCTAVILTNNTVPPGKTGEIKAIFNSTSYLGNIKKSINVFSNDPDSPNYKLTIYGEIIEDIIIKPKNINFGSIYLGGEINKTVTIKSQTNPNFKIKKITPSKPFINASIAEKNKEGYILKIALKDDIEIGRFSGGIYLETNSLKQPKVLIPFFGEKIGDITTYPKKIYYGFITKGKEMVQKLFVKVNKDDIRILNIKVSPDYLSAKIIEKHEKNNPHYLIEIKLHKEAAIGKIKGFLKLHTNSKIQPIMIVPIIGEIEKG